MSCHVESIESIETLPKNPPNDNILVFLPFVADDGTIEAEWMSFLEYRDLGMAFQHIETNTGMHDGAHYRSKVYTTSSNFKKLCYYSKTFGRAHM